MILPGELMVAFSYPTGGHPRTSCNKTQCLSFKQELVSHPQILEGPRPEAVLNVSEHPNNASRVPAKALQILMRAQLCRSDRFLHALGSEEDCRYYQRQDSSGSPEMYPSRV